MVRIRQMVPNAPPSSPPRKRGSRACPWREQGAADEVLVALGSRFRGNDASRIGTNCQIRTTSRVKARVVSDTRRATLQTEIRENVEPGSRILTDAWVSYRGLSDAYTHEVIDHTVEYVRGTVHTNGIENFWSLLKRTLRGTYVHVDPEHLDRYVDEQALRFNERDENDSGRFAKVMESVPGRRLTYILLTKGH